MFLDYLALFLLVFTVLVLFYGVIAIHDIPYEIAKKRNHPQQDAIHVAGWISLFTLHVLWPFLWIWSMLYREDRGWGFNDSASDDKTDSTTEETLQNLEKSVAELRNEVDQLQQNTAPTRKK